MATKKTSVYGLYDFAVRALLTNERASVITSTVLSFIQVLEKKGLYSLRKKRPTFKELMNLATSVQLKNDKVDLFALVNVVDVIIKAHRQVITYLKEVVDQNVDAYEASNKVPRPLVPTVIR